MWIELKVAKSSKNQSIDLWHRVLELHTIQRIEELVEEAEHLITLNIFPPRNHSIHAT